MRSEYLTWREISLNGLYPLKKSELDGVPCLRPSAKRLLFLKSDVEAACVRKFGSRQAWLQVTSQRRSNVLRAHKTRKANQFARVVAFRKELAAARLKNVDKTWVEEMYVKTFRITLASAVQKACQIHFLNKYTDYPFLLKQSHNPTESEVTALTDAGGWPVTWPWLPAKYWTPATHMYYPEEFRRRVATLAACIPKCFSVDIETMLLRCIPLL